MSGEEVDEVVEHCGGAGCAWDTRDEDGREEAAGVDVEIVAGGGEEAEGGVGQRSVGESPRAEERREEIAETHPCGLARAWRSEVS